MAGPIPISAPSTGQVVQSPLLYQQLNQANSKNGYDQNYADSLGQMWNQYMGQGNTAGANQVHQAANAYRDMNGMAGTYNPTTGAPLSKTANAVGNPNTIGMPPNQPANAPQSTQPADPNGWSPTVRQFYDNYQQLSGGPSGSDLSGIQKQAQNFADQLFNKAQTNYNNAVQHAQSNQQVADQDALNAYQRGQQGLQTDSFLNYLKGQNELGSRGVGMTGGAFDDLGARTSLEYQRQLSGLLNNYQTAQMQAQRQLGDAQYSAQQALQNANPAQQAEDMYRQLYQQLMTNRNQQANTAASLFNTALTDDRTRDQNAQTNAYNYAKLIQDHQDKMLPYQFTTADEQAKNQLGYAQLKQKAITDFENQFGFDPYHPDQKTLDYLVKNTDVRAKVAQLTGVDPVTGKQTDSSSQDWAKIGLQQQANQISSFRAQSDDAYHQAMVNLDQQKVNQESRKINDQEKQWVAGMQDKGLQRQATGVQSTLNNVRTQISSLMGKLESASPEDKPMIQQQIAQLQAQETMQKNALDHILNQDPSQSNPDMSGFPADATPNSSFSNFLPNL